MGCSRVQLLTLLRRIRKELARCRDVACARRVLDEYISMVETGAENEVLQELLRP